MFSLLTELFIGRLGNVSIQLSSGPNKLFYAHDGSVPFSCETFQGNISITDLFVNLGDIYKINKYQKL